MKTDDWRLIENTYRKYRDSLYLYIKAKVADSDEAEDLTQDVFLRMMDSGALVGDTVGRFAFVIARNLVCDYLRRVYMAQEIGSYLSEFCPSCVDGTEERIAAADLLRRERERMELFPEQRRKVYAMARFGGRTIPEISSNLRLSRRTVENHLYLGRKEMRDYMRQYM